jgi:hypothetical protein
MLKKHDTFDIEKQLLITNVRSNIWIFYSLVFHVIIPKGITGVSSGRWGGRVLDDCYLGKYLKHSGKLTTNIFAKICNF